MVTSIEIDKEILSAVMKAYNFKTQKEAVNTTLKRSLDLYNNDELKIKEEIEHKKEELKKIDEDEDKIKTTYEKQIKELKQEMENIKNHYYYEKISLEKKKDKLDQEIKLLTNNLNDLKDNQHLFQKTEKVRIKDFENLKTNYIYYDGDVNQYESSNNLYELISNYSEKYDMPTDEIIKELNKLI